MRSATAVNRTRRWTAESFKTFIFRRIYVADECNNRISLFSPDGADWLGHILTKEDGLVFPHAISVFSDGAIAVADDNKVVKVYSGNE